MATLFWLCLAAVSFAYVGYPACMALMTALRPMPIRAEDWLPRIDVLLVVNDAATDIGRKLDNLLALDYPPDRLRINVACDGCTDATESIARAYPHTQVRVFACAERRGKSACIGNALPHMDAELVLFTDVRQRLEPNAARVLAAVLADPAVGAASGELVLEAGDSVGGGINAYWRYEKALRRLESASGSLVGATGALYAVKREAMSEVPPGLILDDMWIPLSIAAKGWRVVFVPQAIAHDRASTDPAAEERRKRRTLAGNFQLLHRWPDLAIPGRHPLALRLWGHKWLRLCVPWLLLLALLSNAVLAFGSAFYGALLLLQVIAYALALVGRSNPAWMALLPIRIASTFLSLNVCAAVALWQYVTKRNLHLWATAPQR
ncbi:MAG: glycosyltransferase family 2 protein [Thermomonas sp.]